MKWTQDKLDSYFNGVDNKDDKYKEEQTPKCAKCGIVISKGASKCRRCFREYMVKFTDSCVRGMWYVNDVIDKINEEVCFGNKR